MKRTKKRSSSPKRLAAIQTSRHFHVAHRKHTGKVLPRGSTSYPLLGMIVLIVGVLIASWTRVVTADVVGSPQIDHQYTVRASVPGPAPTTAATIDTPKAGTHFTARPILVSGTCPVDADGGYVSLYRNNFYSGSALCDATGKYQLSTDLFAGANQLVARIFNFTDIAGPDSDPVTVYLDAPVSTSTGSNSDPGPAAAGFSVNPTPASRPAGSQETPVTVSTDFGIKGYYTGQPSTWHLDVEGGTAPYAIAADWGDGTTGMVSQAGAGPVQMTHTYAKAGPNQGSYTVRFTVTDANGMQTFLQVLVIVNSRQQSPVGSVAPSGGSGYGSNTWHVLRNYIWPGYGVVLLMLASFWLGERREAHILKPRMKRARHA